MHLATARLLLCVALACSACGAPQLSIATGTRAWSDPGRWSLYGTDRDLWMAPPGYGRSPFYRPSIACDHFGRCWQVGPFDRFARGYGPRDTRPPRWAGRLPESAEAHDRFLRPRSGVVCDRATRICYKKGKIDKSDTQRMFGERAGDRADGIRDRHRRAQIFVPQRDVACDRERRVCFEDGDPDRRLTRRYFGKRAARAID